MRASAHLEAEQTIESDRREQNREQCETGEKSRHDVSVGNSGLDRVVHGHNAGDRDVAESSTFETWRKVRVGEYASQRVYEPRFFRPTASGWVFLPAGC